MAHGPKVVNPDRQIDCTGLFCPIPIVMTRQAIRDMSTGDVLEMLSDDPASDADMRTWAHQSGHDLVEMTQRGTVYRFLVRKTH